MISTYEINGLKVKTGDLICTADGDPDIIIGRLWRIIGTLIPGDVDHIVVYVGPDGKCVEAGARLKVITFNIPGNRWNAADMEEERGPFRDIFYGVAYPLADRGLTEEQATGIRSSVARYCIDQIGKPYNLNFLDSSTQNAFYCSQLAYQAYLRAGINIVANKIPRDLPGSDSIIFPEDIWHGSRNVKTIRTP